MVVIIGAEGTFIGEGICKNCGNVIMHWKPDYFCPIHQTDQPLWLHVDYNKGSGVFCEVTQAEPIEE